MLARNRLWIVECARKYVEVLRRASAMRQSLGELGSVNFLFQRSAVVALGFLGEMLPTEAGIAGPADAMDLQAYVLTPSFVANRERLASAESA